VTLLVVDVWVEQVRVTGTSQFSNTAQPAGADQVNGGTVQPQSLTSGQAGSLPSGEPATGTDTGAGGAGGSPAIAAPASGGAGSTTVGVPAQPYFDSNGNQLGIAPSTTGGAVAPATTEGPIVGVYGNGEPVIGGAWQQGFYDSNNNWIHP